LTVTNSYLLCYVLYNFVYTNYDEEDDKDEEDVVAAVEGPASAKAAYSVQAASCLLASVSVEAAGSVNAVSCPVVQNHNQQRDILGSNFIGRTSFLAMNYNLPLGPFSESIVICTICCT
jgi:hypothetical protein